jgi:hypothetical protein
VLPPPNYAGQPAPLTVPGPLATPVNPPSFPALPPIPTPPPPPLLPSQLAHIQAVTHPIGPFTCSGFWCLLKTSGKASRGAQNCRFRRCAGCCHKEFEQAEKQYQVRLECPAHNLHKSTASAIIPPAPNLPVLPNVPVPPSHDPVVPAPSGPSSAAMAVPTYSSKHLKADAIGHYWNVNALDANTRAAVKISQKAENRLLKLAQHHSVMPIIWYKVSSLLLSSQ